MNPIGEQKSRINQIILNGVKPKLHEYAAILTLSNQNKTIELIPESKKYRVRSPDFKMDGKIWELKCPQGKGKYLIRDTIRQASKQSANIVIDLRRIKMSQNKAIN